MRVEKWQALGNDYIVVEAAALPFALTAERVRLLCDRHRGVGGRRRARAGQPPDEPGFVARLRIFNPDGSEAELSGNGAREAIMYLHRRGWTDAREFSIQTVAGELRPRIESETRCTVDMGRARLRGEGELEAGGRRWAYQHVEIGNPQTAIRVARSATRSPRSTFPRSARGSSTTRCFPTARTSPGGPRSRPTPSARGSSSAAWGRRCRRAPVRPAPPSRTSCAAATPRSRCTSTAAS